MLCELGHRQLFFAPLTETLSGICPDVAQLMTDRLPEVYDSCGTWPRATPGSTGGAPAPKEPDEEVPEEEIIDDDQVNGDSDDGELPSKLRPRDEGEPTNGDPNGKPFDGPSSEFEECGEADCTPA